MSGHQYDEGHTIAGWTGCVIATAGSAVAGVGIVGWRPGIWVGSVIMGLAALVVWGLHLAGWGKPPGVRTTDQWGLRVRDRSARHGHVGCLWCQLAGRRGDPVRTVAVPKPAVPASRTESQADQLS
ncbi:HGxxPAAW family protein [Streptomyces sp. NPDC094034]|uniref:HGxxPAAW family protein n=1 Tax=Streptomyces sp. NPDC094034 TaxID=3155309 RepID=UPI00331C41B1